MILIVCTLFVLISFTVFLPANFFSKISIYKIKLPPKLFFIAFGVFLIFIAGFRGDGVDRDYENYVKRFNQFKESWSFTIEPSFIFISKLVKVLFNSNVTVLFIIYALLGIGTKLYAIKQLSHFWTLSLLIYLSYLFTIHDLTQIRAGVAAGFIMLSIKPLYEKKAFSFFLFSVCAILFHYSAVIALFFWFLNPKKINKYLYILLIPIAYAIHYLSIIDSTILKNALVISPLVTKFLAYQYQNNSLINIYNVWQLMRVVLGILFVWKIEIIMQNNKYGIILTKLYVIATFAYVVLAFNPVFASRINDLLAISDIILIPSILYFIKPNVIAKIVVIFIGFSYLFLNLFFNKIII